jgi:hypothetical protein
MRAPLDHRPGLTPGSVPRSDERGDGTAAPVRQALLWGAVAGGIGAAAMTVVAVAEERWLDRPRRRRGGATLMRLCGMQESPRALAVADQVAHWGYGAGLGAVQAAAVACGAPRRVTTAAHFLVASGAWKLALRRTGVDRQRPGGWRERLVDAGNHAVYTLVTTAVTQAATAARSSQGSRPR